MNTEELLRQLGRPFAIVGAILIIASLGTGAGSSIMGITVDPDKWIAGVVVGLTFIGISIYRNTGQ